MTEALPHNRSQHFLLSTMTGFLAEPALPELSHGPWRRRWRSFHVRLIYLAKTA
jgi:hypothetical protein